jgi:hypothetical protein
MLGENQQRRPQLQNFLGLLTGGKSIDSSFSEAFQTDYAVLERELHVIAENRTVDLHTDDPSKIEFVSYTTRVSDSIACGPVNPELAVVIFYRAGGKPQFLGEPIRIEFVEKK